jgi:D-alanyl-D-alanine carboxypeptidase (penicillin-binding protein 5/6)
MTTRHPGFYAHYFGKRTLSHNGYTQVNHDPITGIVRGADGIKTGFTREAGYTFLGSAKRDGARLGIVLAGIGNGKARARIARDYLELGFTEFDRKRIFAADAVIGTANVQNGAARSVALRSAVPVTADIRAGTNPKITMLLRYTGPVRAPIHAGSEIAELEVKVAGFEPYTIPLEAASNVGEANALQRVFNGVAGLFS